MRSKSSFCALFFPILIAACSSSGGDGPINLPPGVTEVIDEKQVNVDVPQGSLFESAKSYYQIGLYSQAKEAFEALRNGYPLGPYAEFSEIKVADTIYEGGEFGAAALLYDDFLKNRPASLAAPYVTLKAARSYQLSQKGLGRDVTNVQKSIELYDQLLNRFPNSVYASEAQYLKKQAQDQLASAEKEVIDFYKKKDKEKAYEARDKAFESRWGVKSAAFEISTEDTRPKPVPVQTASNINGSTQLSNIPEYEPEPIKLQAARLKHRTEPKQTTEKTAVTQAAHFHLPLEPGKVTFRGVDCNSSKNMAFVFLSSPIAELKVSQVEEKDGLAITVSALQAPGQRVFQKDCFSEKDLTVTTDGVLHFASQSSPAQVMQLSNPDRLLLVFE